jgi:hypothetical protein
MNLGSTQLIKEMSIRADSFTTFIIRLSWHVGASTPWNHKALSRPVMGLLYLYWQNDYK